MRVRTVLLVGSPYDAFLLESAGFHRHTGEPGGEEAAESSVDDAPQFVLAETGEDALRRVAELRPDMVIADYTLPDMSNSDLIRKVHELKPDLHVSTITSRTDLGRPSVQQVTDGENDSVFIWQGDPAMLRALVHLHEDERNLARMLDEGVLALLLVEDEPPFYSHYLPLLYEQLRAHTLALLPPDKRPTSPWSALRGRPLVILRRTFEGACAVIDGHPRQLIAMISDMQFPVQGHVAPDAGLRLLYRARAHAGHLPVIIQSHQTEMEAVVREASADFVSKDSPHLYQQIGAFLQGYCGFGPFLFGLPGTKVWGQAENLAELRTILTAIPDVLYEYHGLHNDFSSWLSVHGYGSTAARVRRIGISDPGARSEVIAMLDAEIAKQKREDGGGAA